MPVMCMQQHSKKLYLKRKIEQYQQLFRPQQAEGSGSKNLLVMLLRQGFFHRTAIRVDWSLRPAGENRILFMPDTALQ